MHIKSLAKNYSAMNFTVKLYSNMQIFNFYISKLCIQRIILKIVFTEKLKLSTDISYEKSVQLIAALGFKVVVRAEILPRDFLQTLGNITCHVL